MSWARRLLLSLSLACLLVLASAAVGLALLTARHEKLLSVQTASMLPTFKPGDALIVKSLRGHSPLVGAVITYRLSAAPKILVTHRLIARQGSKLITAGDALGTRDQPVANSQLVGQAMSVLPGLGQWLDRLHQPLGLLLMVYLPAGIIIYLELHRLARRIRPPQYRAIHFRVV